MTKNVTRMTCNSAINVSEAFRLQKGRNKYHKSGPYKSYTI